MPVLPQFFRHFLPKLKSTVVNSAGLYSRRSRSGQHNSARKVKEATDSASTAGRKHHLSSNSVTGDQPTTTTPWDDYDDATQLHMHIGDRADLEGGGAIDLRNLQEARARRRNSSSSSSSSEHDDVGIVVVRG